MDSPYQFSCLDEIMPSIPLALIFCFPCPSLKKEETYSLLQKALSKLVLENPFLSGEIVRQRSDQPIDGKRPGGMTLKISEPPEDIKVSLNDMTLPGHEWKLSYDELRISGMPMSKLHREMLAPRANGQGSKKDRFFEAQVNFIPGGCLLCASSNHAYVDASGFALIMSMWARQCQAMQTTPVLKSLGPTDDALPSALTRHIPRIEYERLKKRPELWQVIGLDWRTLGESEEITVPYSGNSAVKTSIFSFTATHIAKIAQNAKPEESIFEDEEPIWISPNDALIAFLWRCIMKARVPSWRDLPHKKDSMVSVAINGRGALFPPIPHTYFGNVVFCCLSWLPIDYLIAPETSLGDIALALRKSIEANTDPQLLSDAVDLASCIPDVRKLGNAFRSWFSEDLVTTTVIGLPFYELDFGDILHKPEFVRLPKAEFNGICSVQPRQTDGTVDVFISLDEEETKRLREDGEFMRYARFISQ